MNRKVLKLISIIILTMLLSTIATISNAGVEVKSGTTPYTSITVSGSYQVCFDMRYGGTLGSNSLDPHLTTNADWAAAAYLGLSDYGDVRDGDGTSVTIDGTSYNSTTNNITGVMNMGKTFTQTASLFPGASTSSYRTALENNINTKYVETLGTTMEDATNKGRAYGETSGWYGSLSYYPSTGWPVEIRKDVLSFCGHYYINNCDYRFRAR